MIIWSGLPEGKRIQRVAAELGLALPIPPPPWLAIRGRAFGKALALQHDNGSVAWFMENADEILFAFEYEEDVGIFSIDESVSHHHAVYAAQLRDCALPRFTLSRKRRRRSHFGPGNIGPADRQRTRVERFWKKFSLHANEAEREGVIALFDASLREWMSSARPPLRSLESLPGGWIVFVCRPDDPARALAAGRQILDRLRAASSVAQKRSPATSARRTPRLAPHLRS